MKKRVNKNNLNIILSENLTQTSNKDVYVSKPFCDYFNLDFKQILDKAISYKILKKKNDNFESYIETSKNNFKIY